MKRQIELVRYGAKKFSIKSSVLMLLIAAQIVNCSTIYEETPTLDNAQRINDVNGKLWSFFFLYTVKQHCNIIKSESCSFPVH